MNSSFDITNYRLYTSKRSASLRVIFLADLHGWNHGEHNEKLIEACRSLEPGLILCGGDMINSSPKNTLREPLHLFKELLSIAPVCAVNGNHETRYRHFPEKYRRYAMMLMRIGVCLVNNKRVCMTVNGEPLVISGLELPLKKYKKFRIPSLSTEELQNLMGGNTSDPDIFHILLAHNPQFARQYFDWGADLTLSGHFHGGLVRLSGNQVAASPYGFPMPAYGYGHFEEEGAHLIVSSGLGDHSVQRRFHNPMELVCIDVLP